MLNYLDLGLTGGLVRNQGGEAPFSPSDIEGLFRWYEPAKETGFNDDDGLSPLADFGTQGADLTEATNPPTYKTNIMNGEPIARFDAVNDVLSGTKLNLGASDFTAFFVFNPDVVTNTDMSIGDLSSANAQGEFGIRIFTGSVIMANYRASASSTVTTVSSASISADTTYIVSFRKSGASYLLTVNGVDVTTTGSRSYSTGKGVGLRIGEDGGTFVDMDFGAFLCYADAISDDNMTSVESYLTSKFIP